MDKPLSYYAFEMLYWCGIRMGELLALTPGFDFEKQTPTINKSYQRLNGRDVITNRKPRKAIVSSKCRSFYVRKCREHIGMLYEVNENDRLFPITALSATMRWTGERSLPE